MNKLSFSKNAFFGILLFCLNAKLDAQHRLYVNVTNIEELRGKIQICLFDSRESYMQDSMAKECKLITVNNNTETVSFDSVAIGKYAVVVFQDLNDNSFLDTNFMRIPKEPYGFSNNHSTTFGPPSFSKASFEVAKNIKIEVELI